MGLIDRCRALLWPDRCILCGGVVAYGDDCCPLCRRKNPVFHRPAPCGEWEAAAVWPYHGPAAGAVNRFKFHGDLDTGRKLARRMVAAWREQCPDFGAECVTFVPMPPERERHRGYNQAELLARWAAEELGLPVIPLLKREGVLVQHQLAASFRRKGVDSSFSLLPEAKRQVHGRAVLLVDDIVTTGSTVLACSRRLEEAGASRIAILAAVRSCGPSPLSHPTRHSAP